MHVLLALAVQLAVALFALALGHTLQAGALAGAAAGSWLFIGREYAQAEYRLIEAVYHTRSAMPAWAPLRDRRAWTFKGVRDWVEPTVVTLVVYQLSHLLP